MYGLTTADLDLQGRARDFIDALIPYEQTAEENDGLLPDEVAKAQHDKAIALGLYATNMPASVGGPGCTTLQQVLVQEQAVVVLGGLLVGDQRLDELPRPALQIAVRGGQPVHGSSVASVD